MRNEPQLSAALTALAEGFAGRPRGAAGGAAAAAVGAIAASVVARVAAASHDVWAEAAGTAAQAALLRDRCAELADAGTVGFAAALSALRRPDRDFADRLDDAIQAPLAIAQAAADVAELAASSVPCCEGTFQADAIAAALLADAAARAAAKLVEVNLTVGAGDVRLAQAELYASDASRAASRALDFGR